MKVFRYCGGDGRYTAPEHTRRREQSKNRTKVYAVLLSWLIVQVGFGIILLSLFPPNQGVLGTILFGFLGGLISFIMLRTGGVDRLSLKTQDAP